MVAANRARVLPITEPSGKHGRRYRRRHHGYRGDFTLWHCVIRASVRMAGNQMDEAVMNYLKRKYKTC